MQNSAAAIIHARILDKQSQGDIFRLAVSGGSTPGAVYTALTRFDDIDWSRVELYLVDERFVPHTSDQSNYKLLYETLIAPLPEKPKFICFDTSLSIADALSEYESHLDTTDHSFFDLILLGMGTDGHTASLFPKDALLDERIRWVGHTDKGDPVSDRLTLTYPAIMSSREIMFLLGEVKKNILEQVKRSDPENPELPAARLIHLAQTRVVFVY